MTPIPTLSRLLAGRSPLPAGAVPLASDKPASLVCLMPSGRWVRWWPGTRSQESLPPETQRDVLEVIVGALGGTAGAVAARLDVSSRTVEAWRHGRAPLPIRAAFLIAAAMSESA